MVLENATDTVQKLRTALMEANNTCLALLDVIATTNTEHHRLIAHNSELEMMIASSEAVTAVRDLNLDPRIVLTSMQQAIVAAYETRIAGLEEENKRLRGGPPDGDAG